jgi:protein-arginine kinase activator protein McsA
MLGKFEIYEIISKLDDRLTLYNCLFVSKDVNRIAKMRIRDCYNEYEKMMKPIEDKCTTEIGYHGYSRILKNITTPITPDREIKLPYDRDKIIELMNQWGTCGIPNYLRNEIGSVIEHAYMNEKRKCEALAVCKYCRQREDFVQTTGFMCSYITGTWVRDIYCIKYDIAVPKSQQLSTIYTVSILCVLHKDIDIQELYESQYL